MEQSIQVTQRHWDQELFALIRDYFSAENYRELKKRISEFAAEIKPAE